MTSFVFVINLNAAVGLLDLSPYIVKWISWQHAAEISWARYRSPQGDRSPSRPAVGFSMFAITRKCPSAPWVASLPSHKSRKPLISIRAWIADTPVTQGSNRTHGVIDILGTSPLSSLNGHHRYSHISVLRGDTVAPDLLGMTCLVSGDAVRQLRSKMVNAKDAKEQTVAWMRHNLCKTMEPLMSVPWIMDVNVTIKPGYGFQRGSIGE